MSAAGWNFADVWRAVAGRFPAHPASIHGDEVVTWAEFRRRADGFATTLREHGVARQERVAQYVRNGPAFLDSLFGAFAAGAAPVNTNFRYNSDELVDLWRDCDPRVVVFDAEFTERCERARPRVPGVRLWLCAGDAADCPPWAVPLDDARAATPGDDAERSGDDLYLLYTGGTTGRPRGVMWRQDDLFQMVEAAQPGELPQPPDSDAFVARINRPGPAVIPASPLIHGTACWYVMPVMSRGGCVVTLPGRSFVAADLLDAVVRSDVRGICIVGDAFGRPLLDALDAEPARWDLSGLRLIFSSGAALGPDVKAGLLAHAPRASVRDGLGSSESGSLGLSTTNASDADQPVRFTPAAHVRVLDDDDRDVVPGSGTVGRLAVGGHIPLGYLGDPVKTAETFRVVDGQRYVVAGDHATVEADGSIALLGRGSSCINTGGEKVYAEEVEAVLKDAAGVVDAVVLGMPDERFGERVVAVVDGEDIDEAALVAHARAQLAAFKVPRLVVPAPAAGLRGPTGKVDLPALRAHVRSTVAGTGI